MPEFKPTSYAALESHLSENRYRWLVTGCAGFIGSHLVERLLSLGQTVRGLDDFSTGLGSNIEHLRGLAVNSFGDFTFMEGDINDSALVATATSEVDFVLHQAALGSVPRSITNPVRSNHVNVSGFLNVLSLACEAKVKNFVYAASSSTYGDHPALPKVEGVTGRPLSPYAVTKLVNELYAEVFFKIHNFTSVGLRYFNVFGPRQRPDGPYAAVIPKWISAISCGGEVVVNGDGSTSRDFCYVENVVEANLLSAFCAHSDSLILNIAGGRQTTLLRLKALITENLAEHQIIPHENTRWAGFREGDVKHSLANVEKAKAQIGYEARWSIEQGLKETVSYFVGVNK